MNALRQNLRIKTVGLILHFVELSRLFSYLE
jgi:hypothetical protein